MPQCAYRLVFPQKRTNLSFDPGKHPRGDPDNKGQFVPTDGSAPESDGPKPSHDLKPGVHRALHAIADADEGKQTSKFKSFVGKVTKLPLKAMRSVVGSMLSFAKSILKKGLKVVGAATVYAAGFAAAGAAVVAATHLPALIGPALAVAAAYPIAKGIKELLTTTSVKAGEMLPGSKMLATGTMPKLAYRLVFPGSRKTLATQAGLFDESEHPRGQPDNAGEFVDKGGGKESPKPQVDVTKPHFLGNKEDPYRFLVKPGARADGKDEEIHQGDRRYIPESGQHTIDAVYHDAVQDLHHIDEIAQGGEFGEMSDQIVDETNKIYGKAESGIDRWVKRFVNSLEACHRDDRKLHDEEQKIHDAAEETKERILNALQVDDDSPLEVVRNMDEDEDNWDADAIVEATDLAAESIKDALEDLHSKMVDHHDEVSSKVDERDEREEEEANEAAVEMQDDYEGDNGEEAVERAKELNEQLAESGNTQRVYYHEEEGNWFIEHHEDIEGDYPGKPATTLATRRAKPRRVFHMATQHAPAGGITIRGKHFPGGEFIPASVVAKATSAQMAQLEHRRDMFDPDDWTPPAQQKNIFDEMPDDAKPIAMVQPDAKANPFPVAAKQKAKADLDAAWANHDMTSKSEERWKAAADGMHAVIEKEVEPVATKWKAETNRLKKIAIVKKFADEHGIDGMTAEAIIQNHAEGKRFGGAPKKPEVDTSHLSALEDSLSRERTRLNAAKTESERKFRAVQVAQKEKEIAGEKKFLGIVDDSQKPEMSDSDLLADLGLDDEKPVRSPIVEPPAQDKPTARKIPGPLKKLPDGTMGNEFLIVHPDGRQERALGRNAADAIKRAGEKKPEETEEREDTGESEEPKADPSRPEWTDAKEKRWKELIDKGAANRNDDEQEEYFRMDSERDMDRQIKTHVARGKLAEVRKKDGVKHIKGAESYRTAEIDGKRYWYHTKKSWQTTYYSLDNGFTWKKSLRDALDEARVDGKLHEASSGAPATEEKKATGATPSADRHDAIYAELNDIYKDPKFAAGDSDVINKAVELEREKQIHKPAAIERSQKEIDGENGEDVVVDGRKAKKTKDGLYLVRAKAGTASHVPLGHTLEGERNGVHYFRTPDGKQIVRQGADGILRFESYSAPWDSLGKKVALGEVKQDEPIPINSDVFAPEQLPDNPPVPPKQEAKEPDPAISPTTSEAEAREQMPHDSPRKEAERLDKAMADNAYAFARASAVENFGEDLKGSARHKANMWRGLADAEKNGTADAMMTRDNLLKAEPHNLMAMITPINALATLAAHLAINAFPAAPYVSFNHDHYVKLHESKYKDAKGVMPNSKPKTPEELRKQYFDAYQAVKTEAERAATEETDPRNVANRVSSLVGKMIADLRGEKGSDYMARHVATDSFNPVANALVDLYNRSRTTKANSVVGRMMDFVGHVKKAYPGEPTRETLDKISQHVQDVIEGDSFNKTFGIEGKGPKKFDPSEAYVAHAERKGGRVIDAATVEAAKKHMLDNVGLRGVQWGNYVTDDERQHHLTKTAEAFADLADAMGVPDSAISLGGKLGLAIGARGRSGARAHYEPSTQVINLTRASGVGSLAHEWGHGLDHYLEDFSNNSAGAKFHSARASGDGDDIAKAMKAVRLAFFKSGYSDRLSDEVRKRIKEGILPKNARNYWMSHHEMFARTFERHIQDKLHGLDRENTYLTGLRKVGHPLWPNKEESAKMAPLMESLFEAIREKHFKRPTTLATQPKPTPKLAYRLVIAKKGRT